MMLSGNTGSIGQYLMIDIAYSGVQCVGGGGDGDGELHIVSFATFSLKRKLLSCPPS